MRPLITIVTAALVLSLLGAATMLTFFGPSTGTPLADVVPHTVVIGSPEAP